MVFTMYVPLHIYGKGISKPKRKMGHITVTADTVKEALETADKAFSLIKITSKED